MAPGFLPDNIDFDSGFVLKNWGSIILVCGIAFLAFRAVYGAAKGAPGPGPEPGPEPWPEPEPEPGPEPQRTSISTAVDLLSPKLRHVYDEVRRQGVVYDTSNEPYTATTYVTTALLPPTWLHQTIPDEDLALYLRYPPQFRSGTVLVRLKEIKIDSRGMLYMYDPEYLWSHE